MAKKRALITGITGQDGAYLAEFLLDKGYEVHGIKRRASLFNTDRVDHLYKDIHEEDVNFYLHYGDLTDSTNLIRIIQEVQPDEIYNLAAQSHVKVSFETPEYTANADALGTLRLLEAIRILNMTDKVKFYQASTSELYGKVQEVPQTEKTPFYPRSPYAAAKLYSYWITVNYREAYGMFACNGILFNHECISENTPVIIQYKDTKRISVKRLKDIKKPKDKGKNIQQWKIENINIWDGKEFVSLNLLTASKRKIDDDFKCRIINTRNGIVTVTNHHNMLDDKGDKIKAREVNIGSKLLHGEFPKSPNISSVSVDEAMFLGMMVGGGYISEDGKAAFSNSDEGIKEKFKELWLKVGLGTTSLQEYKTEYGNAVRITLNADSYDYLKMLRNEIYTFDGYKKVPDRILNASKEVQRAFLEGYNCIDGFKSNPCTYEFKNFKTNSDILLQGLLYLISQTTGQQFNLTFEEDEKYYGYYSVNLLSPVDNQLKESTVKQLLDQGEGQREINRLTGISRTFIRKIENGGEAKVEHHLAKDKTEVKKLIYHQKQPEWVYDVETESGKLMAGVGTLVIANSPVRGETFVTRKITRAAARIKLGLQKKLYLGNLDAKRDWGYAKDYVEAMWLMLQQDEPDDFVIATGEAHSVREFVELAFKNVGISITWQGKGVDEKGIDAETGKVLIEIDPRYFRPTEVDFLLGDATKAKQKLGWQPKVTFEELVEIMVKSDLEEAKKDLYCKKGGFEARKYNNE